MAGLFRLRELALALHRPSAAMAMKHTLVDLFELRETQFDGIDIEVELEDEPPPSPARMLKILTPTKPIRPWLSEDE